MNLKVSWNNIPEFTKFFPIEQKDNLVNVSSDALNELIKTHLKEKVPESEILKLYTSILSNTPDPTSLIKLLVQNKIYPKQERQQREVLALTQEKNFEALVTFLLFHGFTINTEEIRRQDNSMDRNSSTYYAFKKYRDLLYLPIDRIHSLHQKVFNSGTASLHAFSPTTLDPYLFLLLSEHVDTESQIRDNPEFAHALNGLLEKFIPSQEHTSFPEKQLELWLHLAKHQPNLASTLALESIIKAGIQGRSWKSFLSKFNQTEQLTSPAIRQTLLNQIKNIHSLEIKEDSKELFSEIFFRLQLSKEESRDLFLHALDHNIPLFVRIAAQNGADPTETIQGRSPLNIAADQRWEEMCTVLLESGSRNKWDTPSHGRQLNDLVTRGHLKIVELFISHGIGAHYISPKGETILSQLILRQQWSLINRLLASPEYRQALQENPKSTEIQLGNILTRAPLKTIDKTLQVFKTDRLPQVIDTITQNPRYTDTQSKGEESPEFILVASEMIKRGCTQQQLVNYFQTASQINLTLNGLQLINTAWKTNQPLDRRVNEKMIAHLLGGAFITNRSAASGIKLEGASFVESLGYLEAVLSLMQTQNPEKQSLLTPYIKRLKKAKEFALFNTAVSLIASEQTNDGQKLKTIQSLHHLFHDNITHLDVGDTFLLPTGYLNPDNQNHAMLLAITKQENNRFHLKLINTGDGVEYNLKSYLGTKEKIYPAIDFDQVPAEKLLDSTFLTALFEPMTQSLVFKNRHTDNYQPQDLYFSLLGEFKEFQSESTPLPEEFITPQRAGVCSMKSLLAYLRLSLGQEPYKALKGEIQTLTLALAEKQYGKDAVIDNLIDDAKANLARTMLKRLDESTLDTNTIRTLQHTLNSPAPAELAARHPDLEWNSNINLQNSTQALISLKTAVADLKKTSTPVASERTELTFIDYDFFKVNSTLTTSREIKEALNDRAAGLRKMSPTDQIQGNRTLLVNQTLQFLNSLPLPTAQSDPYAVMTFEERNQALSDLTSLSVHLTRLNTETSFADGILGHYSALALSAHLIALNEKERPPEHAVSRFLPDYSSLTRLRESTFNHAYQPNTELRLEQLLHFFETRDHTPNSPKFFNTKQRVGSIPNKQSAEFQFFASLNIPESLLEQAKNDWRNSKNFRQMASLREYQMAAVWADDLKKPVFESYVPKTFLQLQTIALAAKGIENFQNNQKDQLTADTDYLKPTFEKKSFGSTQIKINGIFFEPTGVDNRSLKTLSYFDEKAPFYFNFSKLQTSYKSDNHRKLEVQHAEAPFIEAAIEPKLYFHRALDLFSGSAFKNLPEKNVQAYLEHLLFHHGVLREAFEENPHNFVRLTQLLDAIELDTIFQIEHLNRQEKIEEHERLKLFTLKLKKRILEYGKGNGLISSQDYSKQLIALRNQLSDYLNAPDPLKYTAFQIWLTTYQHTQSVSAQEAKEIFTHIKAAQQLSSSFSKELKESLYDPQLEHEVGLARNNLAQLTHDFFDKPNVFLNELVFPAEWSGSFPTFIAADLSGKKFAQYHVISGELLLSQGFPLTKEKIQRSPTWKNYFNEADPPLQLSFDSATKTFIYTTEAKDGEPITLRANQTHGLILEKSFENQRYQYLPKETSGRLFLPALVNRDNTDLWFSLENEKIIYTERATGKILWSLDLDEGLLFDGSKPEINIYRWLQWNDSSNALTAFQLPSEWLIAENFSTGKVELQVSTLKDAQNTPLKFISKSKQLKNGTVVEELAWSENPAFHIAKSQILPGLKDFKEFLVLEDAGGAKKVVLSVKAQHGRLEQSSYPYLVLDLNANHYPHSKQPSKNLYLSYLYAQKGQYATAMEYLKLAEPLQPYSAEEFKLLGWIFTSPDEHPDAIALRAYAGYLGSIEGGLLQRGRKQTEPKMELSFADEPAENWACFWSGEATWKKGSVEELVAECYATYLGTSGNVSKPLKLHTSLQIPIQIHHREWRKEVLEAQKTGLSTLEMIQMLKKASHDQTLSFSDKKSIGLCLIGFLKLEELENIPLYEFENIQLEPLTPILENLFKTDRPELFQTSHPFPNALLSLGQFYSLLTKLRALPSSPALISTSEEDLWLSRLLKQTPISELFNRRLQLSGYRLNQFQPGDEPLPPQPKITNSGFFSHSSNRNLSLSEALSKISPLTRPKQALQENFFSLANLAIQSAPQELKRVLMFSAHDPDPECQAMRILLLSLIEKDAHAKDLQELIKKIQTQSSKEDLLLTLNAVLNEAFVESSKPKRASPEVSLTPLPLLKPKEKPPPSPFSVQEKTEALPGADAFIPGPQRNGRTHPSFPEQTASSEYLNKHLEKIKKDYLNGCLQTDSKTRLTLKIPEETDGILTQIQNLAPVMDTQLAYLENRILDLANTRPPQEVEGLKAYLALKGKKETPITLFEAIGLFALNNPLLFKQRVPVHAQELNQAIFDYLKIYMQKQRLSKAAEFVEKAKASLDQEALKSNWQKNINQAGLLLTYQPPYNAVTHPHLLAFESLMTQEKGLFLLRPDQIEDLKSMAGQPDAPFPPIALQRIMGAGKTVVLGAILARMKADGTHLSIFIPPKELFETNAQDLKWLVKHLFGQETKTIRFDRSNAHITMGHLNGILNTLNEAISKRKLLVVSPKTLFNLHNKYIELLEEIRLLQAANAKQELTQPLQNKVELLGKILLLMRKKGIATIDEVDSAIAPFREFNFPVENRVPLDRGLVQMIGRLMAIAATDPVILNTGLDLQGNQQSLLSKEVYHSRLKSLLVEKVLQELQKDPDLVKLLKVAPSETEKWKQLESYWKGESPLPAFVDELGLSGHLQQAEAAELIVTFYKQFDSWLSDSWSASANEQYGRSQTNLKRGISIPYTSATVPDEVSEFAMPVDMINKSFQWYLSEGLSLDQARRLLQQVQQKSYKEWLNSGRKGTPNESETACTFKRLFDPLPLEVMGLSLDKPDAIACFQHLMAAGKPNLENLKLRLSYYTAWLEKNRGSQAAFELKFEERYGLSFSEAQELANGKDDLEAIALAKTLLRYTPEQVKTLYDFLIQDVFSQETIWSSQIFSSPQTLVSLFKICQGYSGTIENRYLYPIDWKVRLDKGANGRIIEKILDSNRNVLHAPAVTAEKMVSIATQEPGKYHALIDAGALCKDKNDFEMAKALINALDGSKIKGILYYDPTTNYLCCLKKDSQAIVLPSTDSKAIFQITGLTPDQLFTYYGHARIKGSNILQDKQARALLTIGEHTTLSDQLQGTLRMRQFLKKQHVDYFYSDELLPVIGETIHKDLNTAANIEDLLLFTALKEGEKQPMLTLQALIQRMENSVRSLALMQILQAPSPEARDALFLKCRELYIRPTVMKVYDQYAKQHPIVPIGEFLTALRKMHLDTVHTLFPESADLNQMVQNTLDQEIDRALRKKIVPELVPMDFTLGQAKERTVEQAYVAVQMQQQQNTLLNEVMLLQTHLSQKQQESVFLNWPKGFHLNRMELSTFDAITSRAKEAQFYTLQNVMEKSELLKGYEGSISDGIVITENAISTLAQENNLLLHEHKTNYEQILFKDKSDQWKLLLLTTAEAVKLKVDMKANSQNYRGKAVLFDRSGHPILDFLEEEWKKEPAAMQLVFEGILLSGRLDILRQEFWSPYIEKFAMQSGKKGSSFVERFIVTTENWSAYQNSLLQRALEKNALWTPEETLSKEIAIALATKNEFILSDILSKLLKKEKRTQNAPLKPQDLLNLYRGTRSNTTLSPDLHSVIKRELRRTLKENRLDDFFAFVKKFCNEAENSFYDPLVSKEISKLIVSLRSSNLWRESDIGVVQLFYSQLLNTAPAIYLKKRETVLEILGQALSLGITLKTLRPKPQRQEIVTKSRDLLSKLNELEAGNPLLLYLIMQQMVQDPAISPAKQKLAAAIAQQDLTLYFKKLMERNRNKFEAISSLDTQWIKHFEMPLQELEELANTYKGDALVHEQLQHAGVHAVRDLVYEQRVIMQPKRLNREKLAGVLAYLKTRSGAYAKGLLERLSKMEFAGTATG